MDDSLKMSVSPICSNKEEGKYAFASFTDGVRTVEIKIPSCKLVYNKGFEKEETEKIVEYVKENMGEIKRMAAEVDVISAIIK